MPHPFFIYQRGIEGKVCELTFTVTVCFCTFAVVYLQHLYSLFSLSMSFLLIWVAWPKATLLLGMGTMVGRLFLEKAYLESHRYHNAERVRSGFDGNYP